MSSVDLDRLDVVLAHERPLAEVLEIADAELAEAEAAGDVEALRSLATRLHDAAGRGGDWERLGIAAARATAVARRLEESAAHESVLPAVPAAVPEPPGVTPAPVAPSQPKGGSRRYAGFWLRLVAFGIDWFILGFALMGFARLGAVGGWLILVAPAAYFVGMTVYADGATLGKKLLGITVRTTEGGPVGMGRALGRAVSTCLLAFTMLGGLVDALTLAVDPRKQAVHDKIGSTVVVHVAPR